MASSWHRTRAVELNREQMIMVSPVDIDAVEEVIAPGVADLGLDVESVEVFGRGRHRLVVSLDADRGVGIDDIAAATRRISALLDGSDVMGDDPYTLEVTSRGVDRPLTAPRHWRRAAGRLVAVEPAEGASFEARIGASDDSGVDLITEPAGPHRYSYASIRRAVVQIELNRKDD